MKDETIKLCNTIHHKELEMQIALQCAPVIAGIKISNILITEISNKEKVFSIFRGSEIKVMCIHIGTDRVTMMLYKTVELIQYLRKLDVQRLITRIGYDNTSIENVLAKFSNRFSTYMKDKVLFPHEMGLLLGYPVEDVSGFMENKGKDYLYTGYWKVYSDLYGALKTFDQYNSAKEVIVELVSRGMSINKILKIYTLGDITLNLNKSVAV